MDYVVSPPDSYFSPRFESFTIEKHYLSRRSLAVAYLMTIGSKALAVTESHHKDELNQIKLHQNQQHLQHNNNQDHKLSIDSDPMNSNTLNTSDSDFDSEENSDFPSLLSSKIISTFDQESSIKRQILLDESIKKFQIQIQLYPGVLLFKKGRNGSSRRLYIYLSSSKNKNDCLVWKSRILGTKVFKLNSLQSVETIPNTNYISSKGKQCLLSTPIVRLKNLMRFLDLQFYTAEETNACQHFFISNYVSR